MNFKGDIALLKLFFLSHAPWKYLYKGQGEQDNSKVEKKKGVFSFSKIICHWYIELKFLFKFHRAWGLFKWVLRRQNKGYCSKCFKSMWVHSCICITFYSFIC